MNWKGLRYQLLLGDCLTVMQGAVFPEELLRIPILATCPEDGIVLDPFSGTGSTVAAALKLGRRGIGIELSEEYLNVSKQRIMGKELALA